MIDNPMREWLVRNIPGAELHGNVLVVGDDDPIRDTTGPPEYCKSKDACRIKHADCGCDFPDGPFHGEPPRGVSLS